MKLQAILKYFSLLFILLYSFHVNAQTSWRYEPFVVPDSSLYDISKLPQPYSDDYPQFRELYEEAWKLAFNHISYREGMPHTPFIDEAFCAVNDWIWDTQFMLLYWRYAHNMGQWILTNKNFYAPIHDRAETSGSIHIFDNPPLFAWSEFLYNKMDGNNAHLKQLLEKDQYLQRHYHWLDTVQPNFWIPMWGSIYTKIKKVDNGYLWEGGRSGMDNTPRGRTYAPVKEDRPNNPNMLWVDAIAQQALSCDYISQMFEKSGKKKEAKLWRAKKDSIGNIINTFYWDEEDQFYYDIDQRDYSFIKVPTPASYWVMLAGLVPSDRVEPMVEKTMSAHWFGGDVPFRTLIPSDPNFSEDGDYWRGAMWLPTTYMSVKALNRYGYHDLAHEVAVKTIQHQLKTYQEYSPHTIWECYSPTEPKPSYRHDINEHARPDFCGWSALGPISLFIENVLGFYDIDAQSKIIHWNRVLEKPHGIDNLCFGDIVTSIKWDGKRVITHTNKPYTLVVNGKKMKVKPFGKVNTD